MDQWYCEIVGREVGPLSARELKEMAARGQILPTDSVRQGLAGAWVAASQVRGLFAARKEPPAAAPQRPVTSEPPSFFGASSSQSPTVISSTPPSVAWPSEAPPSVAWPSAAPAQPAPPPPPQPEPPPPASMASNVAADIPSAFDVFAEPDDGVGMPSRPEGEPSVAQILRQKRKQQQQMLIATVLVFVIAGLIIAALFLSTTPPDAAPVAETTGLRGIQQKLQDAEVQKVVDQRETEELLKEVEKPDSAGSKRVDPLDSPEFRMGVGDVTVRVAALTHGSDQENTPENQRLLITVEVKNPNSEEKMDFPAWSRQPDQGGATLTDNQGKVYASKPVLASAELDRPVPTQIEPNQTGRDVVSFEYPMEEVEFFQLELPGAAFGQTASASIKIPAKLIVGKPYDKQFTLAELSPPKPRAAQPSKKAHGKAAPGTPEYDFGIDEDDPAAR